MDYSLLTVVAYNPDYIELHPHEFEHDENGELVLPIKELNPQIIKNSLKSKKS
jgi:hypothetical protein